ncbi:Mobile element protein [Burkholderia sp. AU4i]|nr:Mobile element protein [Burkholderia sp. AU4i]MDW9233530.1 hypothetical protein [Burkholderia cepacia]MDW9246119.1 hypothetical protein [Burkholderia cepacia]QOH36705.1 hypothetical protein C7S14_7227 [Burkholderia cepacia]
MDIDFRRPSSAWPCRWHFCFPLSLRDIEELLFERGVVVSYSYRTHGENG